MENWDRMESEERVRRARARKHLERVRSQRDRSRVVWPGRAGSASGRAPGRSGEPSWSRHLVAVLAGSLLAGAAFGDGWLLAAEPIEHIAVRGAARLAPADVAEATGVARGTTLTAIDVEAVVERLLTHPWIASARVLRMPGGAVVVDVTEREPLATVRGREDTQAYAVDVEGRAFAPAEAEALAVLPRLRLRGDVAVMEPSETLARAVVLAERLVELGIRAPSEIAVPGENDALGYGLHFSEPDVHFVLGRNDLEGRLEDVARLFEQQADEIAGAASVDLRFEDQVVLRQEPVR
jgi:cell division septal protein FtsQ